MYASYFPDELRGIDCETESSTWRLIFDLENHGKLSIYFTREQAEGLCRVVAKAALSLPPKPAEAACEEVKP